MTPRQEASSTDHIGIPVDPIDVENRRRRIEHLELSAVMTTGRGFMPVYIALLVALAVIVDPGLSRAMVSLWIAIYLIYTVVSTVATSLYHEDWRREYPERVQYWRRFVSFSALTHGLILGSLAFVALPGLSPTRQLTLTCFIFLVTTGAVLYVSALLPALMLLTSAALLPYVIAWTAQVNVFDISIASCLFIAWILNLFMSWIHHGTVSRILYLAADNEVLSKSLGQKNRELKAADQARLQLLAITSHDLRQPVHALRLILAHVSEHDGVEVLKQQLGKMREVSDLIAQMLTELLDLSTLEHESYIKRMKAVCLSEILRQLKTSQEPLAKKKGISLEIDTTQEMWVQADPNLLRRMLLNLISNGIKYTGIGGVSVECIVEHDHVLLSIRDTGIGIPPERLNDIFRPYVKINSLTSENDGVGLGLAIVHRAALVQGLRIRAASKMGVGSIFEMNIPLVSDQPHRRSRNGSAGSHQMPRPGTLVAVVDDDFFALEALVALLKRWGYLTVSGETLSTLQEVMDPGNKPALIIADNHLSSIEFGPDIIVAIRNQFDDELIPAILMTGDTNVTLDNLHHVKIAYKPLDPEPLRMLVLNMTAHSSEEARVN